MAKRVLLALAVAVGIGLIARKEGPALAREIKIMRM